LIVQQKTDGSAGRGLENENHREEKVTKQKENPGAVEK